MLQHASWIVVMCCALHTVIVQQADMLGPFHFCHLRLVPVLAFTVALPKRPDYLAQSWRFAGVEHYIESYPAMVQHHGRPVRFPTRRTRGVLPGVMDGVVTAPPHEFC